MKKYILQDAYTKEVVAKNLTLSECEAFAGQEAKAYNYGLYRILYDTPTTYDTGKRLLEAVEM